ncbi:unnamed protein product [Acanthoscelides obtectus]|uniref:C2H2-type domain-containing protein n=1 Tax=Acanthoscelides obtectus TaxID=200917 RepID=A0A9P0LJE6_ACAOB|nr:unnamed protein product [Acanthoscelides obtectus]CAK1621695.1 Zinc finger protein 557 [Acanthoscelides obtectus]
MDISLKCRACSSESLIMCNLYEEITDNVSLKDILVDLMKFQGEPNDGLSPHLCKNCTDTIVDFYNLKKTFLENEAQNKHLVQSEKVESCSENGEFCDDYIPQDEPEPAHHIERNVSEIIKNETTKGDYVETVYLIHDKPTETEVALNEDVPQKLYKCYEVSKGSKTLKRIFITNNSETPAAENDQTQGQKRLKWQCKDCNEVFTSEQEYKKHLRGHKNFICELCGNKYSSKKNLMDHMDTHEDEAKYVCPYCNKGFKQRTTFHKHKKIHTHPKQKVCEICGKRFTFRETLRTHMYLCHTENKKRFECTYCNHTFTMMGGLRKHIRRRHLDDRQEFACTECNKVYKDKFVLNRHIKVQHGELKGERHDCHCGKSFAYVESLKKHMKKHHPECDPGIEMKLT